MRAPSRRRCSPWSRTGANKRLLALRSRVVMSPQLSKCVDVRVEPEADFANAMRDATDSCRQGLSRFVDRRSKV